MMIKCLLVANRHEIKTGPLAKIFKYIQLPFPPNKDMDIEYEEGWGLSHINYIYLSLDGSLEIGIQSFSEENYKDLIETGNWKDKL